MAAGLRTHGGRPVTAALTAGPTEPKVPPTTATGSRTAGGSAARRLDETSAAVDRQDRPGDEAIAHQENDTSSDLFRSADPADRSRRSLSQDRLALRAEGIPQWRVDQTGRHGVDPDRGEVEGERSGEPVDRGDGRGPEGGARSRTIRVQAGHERDRTAGHFGSSSPDH